METVVGSIHRVIYTSSMNISSGGQISSTTYQSGSATIINFTASLSVNVS